MPNIYLCAIVLFAVMRVSGANATAPLPVFLVQEQLAPTVWIDAAFGKRPSVAASVPADRRASSDQSDLMAQRYFAVDDLLSFVALACASAGAFFSRRKRRDRSEDSPSAYVFENKTHDAVLKSPSRGGKRRDDPEAIARTLGF